MEAVKTAFSDGTKPSVALAANLAKICQREKVGLLLSNRLTPYRTQNHLPDSRPSSFSLIEDDCSQEMRRLPSPQDQGLYSLDKDGLSLLIIVS